VATPAISVVVPSHDRALRLRWLLNALEDQTLGRDRFEVIVVHDYDDEHTRDILERHPLHAAGVLRHERIPPGTGRPSRQRNIGWRAARAPVVAFTDDDCRPTEGWLEELLAVSERNPGAIVQGATDFDPYETDVFASPHYRTVVEREPPGPFAQTCNVLYPRDVLERVGGFDETMPAPAGEDLDLATRARAAGAGYVGAPDALTYHCVESYTLLGMLRLNRKWQDIAYLAKRHPEIRETFTLRLFWRETHARFLLAVAGLLLARVWPPFAALAIPYLRFALRARGTHLRARVATAVELPGRVVIDAAEVATMVQGSIKHRTVVI
jgi:glycosyltransferase involved in cell wall biosynthesis